MFRFVAGAIAALLMSGAALAADQPQYGPAPAWVKPVTTLAKAPDPDGAAAQVLLRDDQMNFGPDGDEFYQSSETKILSPQGLEALGNILIVWQPDSESLTIHTLEIIRGGQTIDLLQGGKKFTVLRRETNLELAMLDGSLTATTQPEGLQVGDVLRLAYTLTRHDPAMQGFSQGAWGLAEAPTGRAYLRVVWPHAKAIRWRATDGVAEPSVRETGAGGEFSVDMSDAEAPRPPRYAPSRFDNLGEIEFSQFAAWSDVSTTMAPLYAKASTLTPASPLAAVAARIKAASADPAARAMAALKLVEDDVRYVFLGMNDGGLVPADADATWSRRFGDCKGKTALLLALLRALDIDAEPALVSTTQGDGLDQRLPTLQHFDHVMVRATIAGKVYWLDATRQGDLALAALPTPAYHWALPVRAKGAALEALTVAPYAEPHFESTVALDATGGLDAPAQAVVKHLYRGEEALALHLALDANTHADADRLLRDYWRRTISWIEPTKVGLDYDAAQQTLTMSMSGAAKIDWAQSSSGRDFQIVDSALGFDANFTREAGPHADAPYAVDYPTYRKWTVTVRLPDGGKAFTLINGGPIDETAAGIRFRRTTKLENGVATMEADERALAPEFPASDAKAASATLRRLADYDVLVRAEAAEAAAPNAASAALIATLTAAGTKAQEGDAAGTLAALKSILGDPALDSLTPELRWDGLYLLAWSAYEEDDNEVAHTAAVRGTAVDASRAILWNIRLATASRIKDIDDQAIALAKIATDWPATLATFSDPFMLHAATGLTGQKRLDLLLALRKAHWKPTSKYLNADSLWFRLVEGLMAEGDSKAAAAVAADIKDYGVLLKLRADKRFDSLTRDHLADFDVMKSLKDEVALRRAQIAAEPDSLEAINSLAYDLLALNQASDALALVQDALGKTRIGPDGKSFFKDRDDQLNRTYEAQAETLRALGRADEAIKSQQRGAAHAEHGAVNVSQTLDLALQLDDLGKPHDAIDALQDFDPNSASAYGKMVWEMDLACAYAQLDDKASLDAAITYLKAHNADNPGALGRAFECAGDEAAVAKRIIADIEDPELRAGALAGLQTFLEPPNLSPWAKRLYDQARRINARPDVLAAVAKYGRIESYPIIPN